MSSTDDLAAQLAELRTELARLDSRVRELEDERAIRELLSHFAHDEDAKGRDEAWVDLWTDDGAYDLAAVVANPDGTLLEVEQRYVGKDALAALMRDPAGARRPEFYGHSLHTQGASTVVRVDGDTAVATTYTLLYQEHAGSVSVVSAAANHWTMRRVGGVWRVAQRRRRQVGTDGFGEALGATPR